MADEEDEETCPLCMEPMDVTDQAASLCDCGYSMCLWCWHHIMEDAAKDSVPGRCPNCRTDYDKERITKSTVDPDKVHEAMQKKKEEKKKVKIVPDKKALANVRVIQRNLVYVVGLSMNLCREEMLRKHECFGQYGKIIKISVNRNSPYSSTGSTKQGPTGSAYITYVRNNDALRCIEAIDGATWEGRTVRACFGTTKYCNAFLKNLQCTNPDCLYLHDIAAEDNDSFTKEQMLARYGNTKSANFFELTHPLAGGPHGRGAPMGMEVHEAELQEEIMRSQAQNIPSGSGAGPPGFHGPGSWGASGKGYMQSPPGSMMPIMGLGVGGSIGSPIGMGMQMAPGGSGMGLGPPGQGMLQHAGSGGLPQYADQGPSWGQVAAAGSGKPPPPPPQPTAAEEWPELGMGPKKEGSGTIKPAFKGTPASGLAPGGGKPRSGDFGGPSNGFSDNMESLGGVMVSKPPMRSAKSPGPLGAPGGPSAASPFLSAAGAQPKPQPAPPSGMVTLSIPKQNSISSARPGSGSIARPGSSKVKAPPPGFGGTSPSIGQPATSGREPPPGFGAASAASAPDRLLGSMDNDSLSSLVESLTKGVTHTDSKPSGEPAEPVLQAFQGLELAGLSGGGADGSGQIPSLPPGFDVWSADVPPAFAGLATAAYNPMGISTPEVDPSARYLFRNAPTSGASCPSSRSGSATGQQPGDDGLSQSRFQSRFQFARQDSPEGTNDPLWEGASGEGIAAAVDVFQLLKQGNTANLSSKGPPPGFGGPAPGAAAGGSGGLAPGAALLQQLQMGGGAVAGLNSGPVPFLDPAIITSRSTPGMAPQASASGNGSSSMRVPPPGFGGGPSQRVPLFARGGDAYSGRGGEQQQVADNGSEHSSWETR